MTKTRSLAPYIDHTNLQAVATTADIARLCREAMDFNFPAVCVHSYWLPLAKEILAATPVKVATVIDFPHGAGLAATRRQAVQQAVAAGADELDIVVALPLVMEGDWSGVEADIRQLVAVAGPDVTVKVILEAGLLSPAALTAAAQHTIAGGACFLKTGTGTGPAATPEMVATLAQLAQGRAEVKAAGGIRTATQARAMLMAGATRIGTSSGVQLVQAG